jgi:hypothetical protein
LSQPGDCRVCKLKERCTRAPFKKIARDINEGARDLARSLKDTPEFGQSSNRGYQRANQRNRRLHAIPFTVVAILLQSHWLMRSLRANVT